MLQKVSLGVGKYFVTAVKNIERAPASEMIRCRWLLAHSCLLKPFAVMVAFSVVFASSFASLGNGAY
ncbi:MAG: hypothetical protein AB8B99_06050 [Phormidesmis sp.]